MPESAPAPAPAIHPVRIGTQSDILGESPIWSEQDQALHWIDIRLPALRRLHLASARVDTWALPELVGSIAFTTDARLLVALADSLSEDRSFKRTFSWRRAVAGRRLGWPGLSAEALCEVFVFVE